MKTLTLFGAAAEEADDVGVRLQSFHHVQLLLEIVALLVAGVVLERLHRHHARPFLSFRGEKQ